MSERHQVRKPGLRRLFIIPLALMSLEMSPGSAWAQLPGLLESGQAGNLLGKLGGGSSALPSVTQAGPANTAGVLQYCAQNNYLSGGAAGAAKTALLGKLPQSTSNSSGFKQGSSGLLDTGQGNSFSLGNGGSGDSLKSQVTRKVCDMVLQHAKSLL